MATLRHHIRKSARHRAIRRAVYVTSAEPCRTNILVPGQCGGVVVLRSGYTLATLPGGHVNVLNCADTHRAAAFDAWFASQAAGSVNALAETHKRSQDVW